jgi:hypothetical protein
MRAFFKSMGDQKPFMALPAMPGARKKSAA